jgi:hypothetical protein
LHSDGASADEAGVSFWLQGQYGNSQGRSYEARIKPGAA